MISVRGILRGKPSKTPVDDSSSIALGLKDLRIDSDDVEDEGLVFICKENRFQNLRRNLKDDDKLNGMVIYPTESLIVSVSDINNAKDRSYGNIKVWTFSKRKMCVHHEIFLPSLPLCAEWLYCPLQGIGGSRNFLAVGSTDTSIVIWDLDPIDVVKPHVVLHDANGHTDSVLGLSWNQTYKNVVASGSADKQVKFWDIVSGRCDGTMGHHSGKVQAVAWSPKAPHVLLSGSSDCTAVLKDRRMPSLSGYQWLVAADVKSLAWHPSAEHVFVVGLENGSVTFFDIRASTYSSTSEISTSTRTLRAHDKAVTSVSFNFLLPGIVATGSADESVKLWDLSTEETSLVGSNNPEAGSVFSIAFLEDNPFMLAIGGSSRELKVWDTFNVPSINQKYGISL